MSLSHRLFFKRPFTILATALTISMALIWLKQSGKIQNLEFYLYDRLVQLRPSHNTQSPPIVLIKVTETDIQHYGHPINDRIMAQLLKKVLKGKPSVIGLDIYRDIPSRGREALKSILHKNHNIVLVEKRVGQKVLLPDKLLVSRQIGFSDLIMDADSVIRRALLMLWQENNHVPYISFAFNLALRHLKQLGINQSADPDNKAYIKLGKTTIPRFTFNDGGYNVVDDGGYQMIMDYRYGKQSFESIDMSQVMAESIDPDLIQGKVVIIGTTSPSVKDQHETPFSSTAGQSMYGIEIHAHIVDQLIRAGLGKPAIINSIEESVENWLIFAITIFASLMAVIIRSPVLLVITIISTAFIILFIAYTFFVFGYWLPVAAFFIAWCSSFLMTTLYIALIERLERRLMMDLFGKFVTKKVAKNLWKHRELFLNGGRPKPIQLIATVIITDLKDYTAIAEQRDLTEVMTWLNHYMSEMTNIIENHGGIVEDYAGDGIKATFGVPIPGDDKQNTIDAQQAVHCAIAIAEKLTTINQSWKGSGFPMERMRIGICTGSVTAGSIGSKERMSYTTIGDTVNLAARLESFNKQDFEQEDSGTVRILIEESTWKKLSSKFSTNYIGEFYLKGRQKKTRIYRVFPG